MSSRLNFLFSFVEPVRNSSEIVLTKSGLQRPTYRGANPRKVSLVKSALFCRPALDLQWDLEISFVFWTTGLQKHLPRVGVAVWRSLEPRFG